MIRSTSLILATLVASLVLGAVPAVARHAIYPSGTPAPASATTVTLFTLSLPPTGIPIPGDAGAQLMRSTWDLDAMVTVGARAFPPAVEVDYVVAGKIAIREQGPLLVAEVGPIGDLGDLRPVAQGTETVLDQGDIAVYQLAAPQEARNVGDTAATVVSVLIGVDDPDVVDPQAMASFDGVAFEQLGAFSSHDLAVVLADRSELTLRRTLLPAGSALPPYPFDPSAPDLLAVEAGTMEVGLDLDGDGTPEWWQSIQQHQAVNQLIGGTDRAIRAASDPQAGLESLPSGAGPKRGDPLIFLTLTFSGAPTDEETPTS
jgi:hypothetical protein